MWQSWYNSLSIIFMQTLGELSVYLPRIFGALLILVIGSAIAKMLKRVVVKLLEAARVSKLVEKTPVEHFMHNAEVGQKVEGVVGTSVYWLLMLVVLQTAVSVLGLAPLTQILDRVLAYIPNVISAVLVLFLGVIVAGVVESLVKGAIRSIDGQSALLLGKVASYLVMTMVVLAAISELGIAREFIMILFIGFVSTVTLGLGLAIGLGGKDVVNTMLTQWYERTRKELDE
ncbi:MAG TPA: hypothetical protein VF209_00220 [Patescibacteria group bacterium]